MSILDLQLELESLKKRAKTGDIYALVKFGQKYDELMAAFEAEKTERHKATCEKYKRSGSLSNLRKTDLYREIKAFYDVVRNVEKYGSPDLAVESEVKAALERLAHFILAPEIIDGEPSHLLPIPREWYQWVPPKLPPLYEFSPGTHHNFEEAEKRRTAFVNAARLRNFCDPMEVDLSKRQGEGIARSCADDYVMELLGKLSISLR